MWGSGSRWEAGAEKGRVSFNWKKAALHRARRRAFKAKGKPMPSHEVRKEAHVVRAQRPHEMKDRGR